MASIWVESLVQSFHQALDLLAAAVGECRIITAAVGHTIEHGSQIRQFVTDRTINAPS